MSEKERLRRLLQLLEKELEEEAKKEKPDLDYILLISRTMVVVKKILGE